MTRKELALLAELRQRIDNEDWIGTTGDRERAQLLEQEHYALLARIDKVLARHGHTPKEPT